MTTLNLHTLTDCGCKAKVYADGSGVDIEYCNLHHAAPDLLAALEYIINWNPDEWNPETARDLARRAIAKANGGDK